MSTTLGSPQLGTVLLLAVCAVAACGRVPLTLPTSTATGGGSSGTGGDLGSGGATATGGTKASGGTMGTGGSPSSGAGGASCSNVQPCGGDVVGTWTVTSSCLKVTGQLDTSQFFLNCAPAPVTGSLQVTGTWIAKSNGTYSDNTTTTGSETITLAASCLQIAGTTITCDRLGDVFFAGGYDSASCTPAAGGGCTCAATVNQTGWAGVLSYFASTSGTYKASGNVVTLDDEAQYSYCVSGNRMTWTPQGTSPTTTGTIAFQK